jgi:hypothetical protein
MPTPAQIETRTTLARAALLTVCIGGMFALSGCVNTSPDGPGAMEFATPQARNRQVALTGLMAVDTAQTVTIGRSPECLSEGNQVAVYAFGSRTPSPQRVLITNAVYIASHWALGSYLDRKASAPIDLSITAEQDIAKRSRWTFMRGLYQFATGFGHGFAVARNTRKGIHPFSSFDCQ